MSGSDLSVRPPTTAEANAAAPEPSRRTNNASVLKPIEAWAGVSARDNSRLGASLGETEIAVDARKQDAQRGADVFPPQRSRMTGFSEGQPVPEIRHDHGFLDDGHGNIDPSKRRAPTVQDHASKAMWTARLLAAQALRPDLADATAAYRHFLYGNGAPMQIDYGRFLAGDAGGRAFLRSLVGDATRDATRHHDLLSHTGRPAAAFSLRSSPVLSPMPTTENWQKAIGGHEVWCEIDVTVSEDAPLGTLVFAVSMRIHFEDRYNFNPGGADIATSTSDDANGRFEQTGLAQEFLQHGTATHAFTFSRARGAATPERPGPPPPGPMSPGFP